MDSDMLFRQADEAYENEDFDRAFSLFVLSAEHGNGLAMTRVAIMYENGEGTPADIAKSIEFDLKAMVAGSSTSILNLGLTYKKLGSIDEARRWFVKALDQGDGEAAFELAKLHDLDDPDSLTIKKYLDLAANAGDLSENTSAEMHAWLARIATASPERSTPTDA
ncbi:tetratricopeptide repeat protein [Massilia sp. S19_KUP03_FR1]|uniref:tetratricopeptide repeat protein n=1 Tax=Massilia sp. S19_KUP03_FR1 TaxID=3025503 RepID=UPI002FCDDC2B